MRCFFSPCIEQRHLWVTYARQQYCHREALSSPTPCRQMLQSLERRELPGREEELNNLVWGNWTGFQLEAFHCCIPNNACGCDPRGGGRVRPVVGRRLLGEAVRGRGNNLWEGQESADLGKKSCLTGFWCSFTLRYSERPCLILGGDSSQ